MNACFQRKCQCQARLSFSTGLETDKFDCTKLSTQFVKVQFSMDRQGFIQSVCGGGAGIPPPKSQFSLPRNLEIEYGYYISYLHVTEHKCVCSEILSQIASEAI